MIAAINLGSHGKPDAIRREIERLTKPEKQKSLTPDEALKMANRTKLPS